MSNSATIDDEINLQVARASASFGRLRDRVWKRIGLSFETKLHVYRAVVLPSLLYGSESWTVYSRHLQKTPVISHALSQTDPAGEVAGPRS